MVYEHPYDGDEGVRIVILHRRYIDPSQGECGTTPQAVEDWCTANAGEWYVIPLWLYDHSGTSYQVGERNPFSCPWDSGRVGIVALKRSEWGQGDNDDHMRGYAEGVAHSYTLWANGIEEEEDEAAEV